MTRFIPVGGLTDQEVRSVLSAAAAAPSLHNSQPWRFHCTAHAIQLHTDPDRALPAADPDHRAMMLACGAALLNLRLAVRRLGMAADVRLLPDHSDPTLLALIRPEGVIRPTPADQRLAGAIFGRHTNRRPFFDERVPEALVGRLRQAARNEQAWMAVVLSAQQSRLRELLIQAHRSQQADPAFAAEWSAWTGRGASLADGVPLRSSGLRPEPHDIWVMRDFSLGSAEPRVTGKDFESDPLIAVIGSFHDLPLAQLQAGQAMQRVLLTATEEGLSASFLSQVVEVPSCRQQLRELIGGGVWPQTVLRLGYGTPAPSTPRRDPADVVSAATVSA